MYPPPPETASSAVRGPRAGFWQRLAAAIIDAILVGVVGIIIEVILGRSIGAIIAFVLGVAYYGWLEGSNSGQTVGKRAMGIRVYDFRQGGRSEPAGRSGATSPAGSRRSRASSVISGCSGTARSRRGTTSSSAMSSCRCRRIPWRAGRTSAIYATSAAQSP